MAPSSAAATPCIMPAEICTEEDISRMVYTFYDRIRADAVLGPVFDRHIDDWDTHLLKMVDFWSSLLRRTGRFEGAPMPKHIALPDLDAALFQRWLSLFADSLADHPNQAMAAQAQEMARRIAQRLWLGYQMGNFPDREPTLLSA